MIKKQAKLKESFVEGVKEAVSALEKNASFQSWMKHPRFREKFSSEIVSLVKTVKGQSH